MSRLWLLGFAVLAACAEKDGEPAPIEEPVDEPELETIDTGGGDAPDPALPPTDVDADCWAWRTFDSARDGTIDSVTLYVYDPATLDLTRVEDDYDVDGEVDAITDYAWDSGGRITLTAYDLNGDGDPEIIETSEYDADGLYTRYTFDDGYLSYVYTYVNEGGLRRHIDVDVSNDGTIDTVYDYTYDDLGRRTGFEGDTGLDGTIDYIATYAYADATGPDHTVTYDQDGDGTAELLETFRYDADGYVAFRETDDRDEDTLEVAEYTYTADADVSTWFSEFTASAVVQYEHVTTYAYLAPGMRSSSVRVYAYSLYGEADDEWAYTWACPR